MQTKQCSCCKETKPATAFFRNRREKGGLSYRCKPCAQAATMAWRKKNAAVESEKARERTREWRAANPERHLANVRRWVANNPARAKQIRRRAVAAHRARRPEVASQYTMKWQANNRPAVNAIAARRRASKRNAAVGWADPFIIKEAYELARLRTRMLGFKWQVDHIVPLVSELVCGLHVEHNLRVIPKLENCSKSNRVWPDMP